MDAISRWNRDARERTPPRPDIRLVVLNACESEIHALDLTACVDFAIGHQRPVFDKDAAEFLHMLYKSIFHGATLLDSFHMAKGCVDGYVLRGQRDPRNFRFCDDKGHEKMLPAFKAASIAWAPAQNWAELPEQVLPALPYYILYVGANNLTSRQQLSLKEEIEQIQQAFMHTWGSHSWGDNVQFHHKFCASTMDLSRELREHDPIILHLACHVFESALSLFEQDLAAQDLVNFIASWTASGKRLRVIIANWCNSGDIWQALSKHVDFVICHTTPLINEDAVDFVREFYGHLESGESLALAFDTARMVSNSYCMAGRKNATNFKFTLPTISSASAMLGGVESFATTVNATEFAERCRPDEHGDK